MNNSILAAMLLSMASLSASAQRMEAVRAAIDCGQVLYRTPVTAVFEVKNKGGKPLRIIDVRKSCGCTEVSYPKTEIPAGQVFKVQATYDAAQMGHFNKQVGLYGPSGKDPLVLTLKGVVVEEVVDFSGTYPFTLGDVMVEKNNIEFDDVNRGDRPVQKIHIMNNSGKPVQPVLMHLPPYLQADVSPSTIMSGRSGVATITLDSRSLRNFGLTQTNIYLGMFPGDKVSADKEISVSAVLLPGFNELSTKTLHNAPQIKLSATKVDLGAISGKKVKKAEIDIANVGHSTLDISSLQMFTAGLKLSLNKTHIVPGDMAKLKITADEKQLKNVKAAPRVLMITNDPKQPKVVITINVK